MCRVSRAHRLQWLKRGSRALFGTILEEQLYILIDTSSSMQPQLQFIKDRIYLLLQASAQLLIDYSDFLIASERAFN